MKIITTTIIGFAIQGAGLYGFIATAGSAWGESWKDWVIAITFLSMAALLFFANKQYTVRRSIVISASLSVGYLAAYDLLAILFYPGLLKDIRILSFDYFQTISPIFGLLFVLYFAGSAAAGGVNWIFMTIKKAKAAGAR